MHIPQIEQYRMLNNALILDPWRDTRVFLFDQVMSGLPANTLIHVGPGTFETQGAGEGVPVDKIGWHVQNGWRILGSGIGATTLELVETRLQEDLDAVLLGLF